MREVPFTEGAPRSLGKIVAVGRNYAEHAAEMNAPAEPVVFLKPSTAVVSPGAPVVLPRERGSIHHEIEIAVWLAEGGANLTPADAARLPGGYALALDLTLRDVQAEAKAKGRPWALAKGFDGAMPLAPFHPAAHVPDPASLTFRLLVNGAVRQEGKAREMLLDVPRLLAFVSTWMTWEPGDVLLTGTPAGVGPIVPGDEATLVMDGFGETRFSFR